jgi:hypothetical protein
LERGDAVSDRVYKSDSIGSKDSSALRASRELEKAFARLGRGRLMAAEHFLINRLLKT